MFKITRQAFYKYRQHRVEQELEEQIIVQMVNEIRYKLPRVGGRKLYHMIQNDLNRLPSKPGRDKFFDILRNNGLLVQPTKRYSITTNSHHRFKVYTNLIKDITVTRPNQVFVSDITYLRLSDGFCYLFLVTDVYSRKIVGYNLNNGLATDGAINALNMALNNLPTVEGLIHHSDRGFQYCSDKYVQLLEPRGVKLSMGEAGNPYENAIAERVNGILKTEFYLNMTFTNFRQAMEAVKETVTLYNDLRPHMSIGYMTPSLKYVA